ncbi:MAG: thiamine pyrophosphate-binding protein [Deltaproteobacteria bacterium]|nr:thiamine pyrophosphate-binding protein [Deltaproteobacteria bacterium]
MRELAMRFLNGELSRRGFLKGLLATGFSLTAARSVVDSFRSYAEAQEIPPAMIKPFQGEAGELIAECLRAAKVKYMFFCNGSPQGPILDALVDKPDINLIVATEEGQAVSMAHGYELASGETPFVVTQGVGVPRQVTNLVNAWKDRSGMVVMTPRTPLDTHGRDSFEDVDSWLDFVKPVTKWRWDIVKANRIAEHMRHAFKLASTPPKSPVFLTIADDLLEEKQVKANIVSQEYFNVPMKVKADPKQVEAAARMIVEAKNPVLIAGHEITRSKAMKEMVAFAELLGIAVTRERGLFLDFPSMHPLFLGDFVANMRFPRNLDLIINIGGQFPRMTETAEDDPFAFLPKGVRIIHARVETDDLARIFPTHFSVTGDVGHTLRDLTDAVKSMLTKERIEAIRQPRMEAAAKFTSMLRESWRKAAQARWNRSPMPWERVVFELDKAMDKDAVVVQEIADNKRTERWISYGEEGGRTLMGRTTGQCLGWGVGAALGVKLAWPDRQVVSLQGDGGIMFGQTEAFWTYARTSTPVITVVMNNRSYDGVRRRQFAKQGKQAKFNKDMSAYMGNPDIHFAKIGEAYGIQGSFARDANELQATLKHAVQATRDGKPYIIDALIERTGPAADLVWHPPFTVAGIRTKNV